MEHRIHNIDIPLKIFIGYDPIEKAAFHVLSHTLIKHGSVPLSIIPLANNLLRPIFNRQRHHLQSNDFAFTRWLVPYLSGFEGVSLFMDCDMIVTRDIAEIFSLAIKFDEENPIWQVACVQQTHIPKIDKKFLGRPQTAYHKKNWSSFMLFNCRNCKILTPIYVQTRDGLELHQFKWVESKIMSLPPEWNYLVECYDKPKNLKIANYHFTNGGPWFKEYARCDFHSVWFDEYCEAMDINIT